MLEKIRKIEEEYLKKNIPDFKPGDEVRVFTEVPPPPKISTSKKKKTAEKEKKKEEHKVVHPQVFQGIVLARKGSGLGETFIVRKVSYGEGVEKTFLLHSPFIKKIEVVKRNKTRRAKLYYLRGKK